MFNLESLVRPNIRHLQPYSSARDEFHGAAKVFIDANENSLGSPLLTWYNRYPDPHQKALKQKIADIKAVDPDSIFIGNGSDEAIDILYRVFCEPGIDNVMICPPTYGMYEVSASINNVTVKRVNLTSEFQPDLPTMEAALDAHTRMIWFCSPNNPTGNTIDREAIEMVLHNFDGLVVIDEAYINFSRQRSFLRELIEYPNLVILQTLSKAWGLAALRMGLCFASPEIIGYMNKVKPPYNISQPAQELALQALEGLDQVNDMIRVIVEERARLADELMRSPLVRQVFPSDANFLLVRFDDPRALYEYLLGKGIVVRDRSRVPGCTGCLRITVGTYAENELLLKAVRTFAQELPGS